MTFFFVFLLTFSQCGAKQPKKEPVGGNEAAQLKKKVEELELALEASRQEVSDLREEIQRLESELDAAAELLGGNLEDEMVEEAA